MDTDTIYQRVAAAHLPVLLIWGKDQTVPFERSALVRKAIPGAEFHPIPDGGLSIVEQATLTVPHRRVPLAAQGVASLAPEDAADRLCYDKRS